MRPVEVICTRDQVMPYRFNYDTFIAISLNRQVPNCRAIEASLIKDLEQEGLLDKVVFEEFDREFDSFEVEIGRRVPVQVGQAVLRACFAGADTPPGFSIEINDGGHFGYTQRIYIGSIGRSRGIHLVPEMME